jgi:choice-of-anchor B domain-containing protein
MRCLLLATWLMLVGSFVWAQQTNNLILLSNWDNPNLPVSYDLVYNEVFGWADGQGREYAILGSHERTYFIEVTNPALPVVRDSVEGAPQCIHRDFKTYGHYCYGVADEGASRLQIMDMSYLPDSVHVVYNSNQYFERAHNVFIDTTRGRLYVVGSNTQPNGVIIFDIATNPANPILLANLNLGSYTHDLSVRNDTAYMNNGGNGLKVVDFTNPTVPVTLAALPSYPQQGYNHSSWLTADGNYLAMCDETRNMSCKMVDVRNLANLNIASYFRSALLYPDSTSIPHNPLIAGRYVCVAYYHDGIQIWDIANPAQPQHVAGYDTYPINVTYNNWYGAWGCYPFLPSGTVLGSDVHNGLFVFRVPFPFPQPMGLQAVTTAATCGTTANGAATVVASGGTPPYTYAWSSGQTVPNPQGMLPGSYMVTVTDRHGYTFVDTVVVGGPAPLQSNAQVGAESCPGTADGVIDINPTGGTPAYSYQWSTGDLVQDLNGLTAGSYSVTITDSAGCVRVDTIMVGAIFAAPIAMAGQDTAICTSSLVVQALPPTQGTGHWQWISSGGQILNPNAAATLLSSLPVGSSQIAWIVFDGQCSAADTLQIEVRSTAYIDAGPDTIACTATLQLQGSSPGNGAGIWTSLPATTTFTNAQDPQAISGGLQPGQYSYYWTIIDGSCTATDSFSVTVSRPPFAAFSYTTALLSATFTNVSQFATSWHWDFGDGATSALQHPTHTYAVSGNYTVCLIATDTCGSDTSCQNVAVLVIANAAGVDAGVSVWPNPFDGLLHLAVQESASATYKIVDVQGKVLLAGGLDGHEQVLALGHLAAGLYFLEVRGPDWQVVRKIVKE